MTSFFDVFGHPKIHQKMDPSKIVIFSILDSLRGSPGPIFGHFGVPKGSRGRHFYSLFLIRFLAWILDHDLPKNTKNKKTKKLVSIRVLQCFVRVAMSKTMQGGIEKIDEKNIDFLLAKRRKIDENIGCDGLPSKNRQKDCHVTLIFRKSRIFRRFWPPRGDPKMGKMGRRSLAEGVLGAIWEPSGRHFGRLVAFFSILTSFWVCFGSLGARFRVTFGRVFDHRGVGKTAPPQDNKTARQQDGNATTQQPNNQTI